jgi:MFS family permease
VALAAMAAGFGQFGVVAALGDVAKEFGRVTQGTTVADKVGLSGTALGIGLAVMRLASLCSLPIIGLADRLGRRVVLLWSLALGLALTVASAASPGYWWFVAVFALGRPLLSTTNTVAQVVAAEETASGQRARAVAVTAAGYGVGTGAVAILHSLAGGALGFRGLFALCAVPLATLPFLQRWIAEPDRFTVASAAADQPLPVLGAVGRPFRRRLVVVVALGFGVAVVTGPANGFVFLYAQDVLHQPGWVTAAMVAGAGITGLVGLLAGRWLADRVGRRPTVALGLAGLVLFGVLTFAGSRPWLVTGYVLAVLAGSVLAPALGALLAELFPTSVRASVAGWWVAGGVLGAVVGLVLFGSVVNATGSFATAAAAIFLPCLVAVGLCWLVPETRGREPEDLWPGH